MRSLPYLLPVAGLIAVTAALATPSGMPAPPLPVGPVDDPESIRTLDRTMEALSPAHVGWVEYGIWQKVRLPGLSFEAEGTYLRAPDNRLRMEVRTRVGVGVGELLTVNDGGNLWQAHRVGNGPWARVTRLELKGVYDTLNGAGVPRLREEFFEGPTLSGIGPLVHTLRGCLIWVKQETVHRPGGGRLELTGVWPKPRLDELAPRNKPWPTGLPRRCVLSLDAATLWPHRVEWWGPREGGDGEEVLAEMEFRNPVVNRPPPPDRCAGAFSFDPGETEVENRTEDVMNRLTARARELAETSRR